MREDFQKSVFQEGVLSKGDLELHLLIFDSKMVWQSIITERNVDKKAEPFLPSPLRIECRTNSYFLLILRIDPKFPWERWL